MGIQTGPQVPTTRLAIVINVQRGPTRVENEFLSLYASTFCIHIHESIREKQTRVHFLFLYINVYIPATFQRAMTSTSMKDACDS